MRSFMNVGEDSEKKKSMIEIKLKNGEVFKIEADEIEFTNPVIIRKKGNVVMSIASEIFECVNKA